VISDRGHHLISSARVSETVRCGCLSRPVRLVRDHHGVPHLFAESETDAHRALGWVMAGDRLWQMDLMRRLGRGCVAEVLGSAFVPIDVLAHTVGLPAAAAAAAETLAGEAAAALEGFAAGVNARIDAGPAAPEFDVLGYSPEPWRAVDSLAVEYFVGFMLSFESLEPKLCLARALGHLGPARGAWLYPKPLPATVLDPERLAAYAGLEEGFLAALGMLVAPSPGGSNAWAVARSRTTDGGTLLAGDPHLLHTAPSPWYLVHLVAPGLDVAGAAYNGGPLVQVGRNPRGAWSVTNLTGDDADLVIEQLDGDRYAIPGGDWEPLVRRTVEIAVRGEPPHRFTVRSTRNGPLLDGVADAAGVAAGIPVALRWKAVQAPGHSVAGWLRVHRSRGLADALAAAPLFDGTPYQSNFVYADADGHIAHLALGALPQRSSETGFLPALGWRGESEWAEIGSLGATPWRVDPTDGMVWTANERTGAADRAAAGDGQPLAEHSYRARRIREVLAAETAHTVATFAALQTDDLDLSARANLTPLREALVEWEPGEPRLAQARDLLLGWNGRAGADSPAAALYHVLFYAEWLPTVFPSEICPGLARRWRVATWGGEAILRAERSPWFAHPAERDAAIRRCLQSAVGRLSALAGPDPAAWCWGDLHRVTFAHALAFAPPLARGALAPIALGGSPFTVNQQRLRSAEPPFGAVVGAGVRMVANLADPSHLHVTLSTGQSSDPESPHFADHLPHWQAGQLLRLSLDPSRIEAESDLVLTPG
jgi:penicillin amidase